MRVCHLILLCAQVFETYCLIRPPQSCLEMFLEMRPAGDQEHTASSRLVSGSSSAASALPSHEAPTHGVNAPGTEVGSRHAVLKVPASPRV